MVAREKWDADHAATIIATHANREGPALLILQALQEAFGHVPEAAIPQVAAALNLSRAEVHGVFSFYHDLRDKPAGRHVLKLCRAEACQAAGCEALVAHAEARLGVAIGGYLLEAGGWLWHRADTDVHNFYIAFAAVALVSASSAWMMWKLPRDAGAEMAGRARPGEEVA